MADLGLYNFIKNKFEQGQTKEQIVTTLLNAGHSQTSIDEAFVAVETNTPPASLSVASASSTSESGDNARAQQLSWDDFRGTFWKNFIWLVILNAIGRIPVPFLGLIVLVISLVIVVQLMTNVWNMTTTIEGSGSVLLTIVSFFSAPLAYVFVYRMTLKNKWQIALGMFEKIFVSIIGAFFLLWILQVIFVVSLLVYALGTNQVHFTVSHTPSSVTH